MATVLPTLANGLEHIWVVGPWINGLLDSFVTGLQGPALGMFALVARIRGSAAAAAAAEG